MFVVVVAIPVVCSAAFAGSFRSFVPVTLESERSGLVMEPGAKRFFPEHVVKHSGDHHAD